MPRRPSAEFVRETRSAMDASASLLVDGDTAGAVSQALIAWKAARAQRSLRLLSDAWMFLVDTMAADAATLASAQYPEYVEGAFYWAETMPEEIQAWFFPALVPHLQRIGQLRLVERSGERAAKAEAALARGVMDIRARIEPFHLDDMNEGRFIDHRVLAIERRAALFADEMFDLDGEYLRIAASEWRRVGRDDRAAFLEHLADDWQARRQ